MQTQSKMTYSQASTHLEIYMAHGRQLRSQAVWAFMQKLAAMPAKLMRKARHFSNRCETVNLPNNARA